MFSKVIKILRMLKILLISIVIREKKIIEFFFFKYFIRGWKSVDGRKFVFLSWKIILR